MKILFRILFIGAIAGVLGFSIMASATDKPYESIAVADGRNEMLIARSQDLVFVDKVQNDGMNNTRTVNNSLQNSALIIPPDDGQYFQFLKFNEAGNMLLLGIFLMMLAGLGRKVLHNKN